MTLNQLQRKHIPKVIENEATVQDVIALMENHLTDLQSIKDEKAVLELFHGGTIQLINTFDALKHSTWQEGLFGIIDKVTDIFMVGNDTGKEVKRYLILSITDSCIDVIISPTVLLIHKIEILKNFNYILEDCSFATKCDLLSRTHFQEKLSLLFESISQVGDYEVQVCITELIFRLVPKSKRKDYMKSIIDGRELWTEFLDIRDKNFEIDCRHFLNKLNKQNTSPMTRVYSYPVEYVSIDGVKLYKPSDDGYDDFWVDFNEGSKRIEIFCEPNFLTSQESQNSEQLWETVSVWAQDVKKYSCSVQGKSWIAAIELRPGAELLSNKETDNLSHLVTIAASQIYDLKTAIENIIKIHHKTSSVDIPICIAQKPDLQATNSTVLPKDVLSHKPLNSLSQQKKDKSVSLIVRSKISVPSEPMTTPASSVITSNTEPVITWQEIQERQKQQIEELAKIVDVSDYEEKNKVFVTEAGAIMREKKKEESINTFNVISNEGYENISHHGRNDTDKKGCKNKSNRLSPNLSVTYSVENETGDSHKKNEKRKDLSSETIKVNKSQAKVKASEKCTDMTWHNMDARASDALVNVVNSPITEGGDNIFHLQRCRKMHNCDMKSTKCGCKLICVKKPQKNSQAQNKSINRSYLKESQGVIFSTNASNNSDSQQTTKSLRPRTRTNSSVASDERVKMNTEKTQSDSDPSQMDIIPGTLPVTQHQDNRQLRHRGVSVSIRESQKQQIKKTQAPYSCNNENEAGTSSIVCKEKKSESMKNKQKQISDKERSYSNNNTSCKLVTSKRKMQNNGSPGNASVDDFKPSKNFRSLRSANRKVAEKSDSSTTVCQNKASNETFGNSIKIKASNENKSESHKKDVEDSGIKTLKDFLPLLQENKLAALDIKRKKKTLEGTTNVKSTYPGVLDISQKVSLTSVDVDTESVEINLTNKTGEKKELNLSGIKDSSKYEVTSSTSSGELFVVVEASKVGENENDVIMETQFEKSPPSLCDAAKVTQGKKQKSYDNLEQSEQLPDKLKQSSKFPDAPSRCQSPYLDILTHSNPKSSFVFSKHSESKLNAINSCGEKSKICNTQTKLISPESKNKIVDLNMNCRKNTGNRVPRLKNTNYNTLIHERELEKGCRKKTTKTANAKGLAQVKLSGSQKTTLDREQGEIFSNNVETNIPTRKLRTRNKTISYKEYDSAGVSCDTSVTKSEKSKKIISQNIFLDNHTISVSNKVLEVSPSEGMKRSQKDVQLMNELGSQAPKKSKINNESQRQFWTSHRMEKTITTMSYSKSIYSLSSDPYDFEAECNKRTNETPNLARLGSSSFMKCSSGNKICAELGQAHYKKQSREKSQLHLNSFSELLKNNELSSRNTVKAKQHKLKMASQNADNKQYNKSRNNNETSSTSFSVVKHTICGKGDNLLLEEDTDSISERGSSRFGLYASQYETDQPDTGLVFPHLDDSIPCTPLQENSVDDDHDKTERKSFVSDLSWLAQTKKPIKNQEQMKSRNYKRNKSAETIREAVLEPGPKYNSLYCKQTSKFSSVLNQTPKPTKRSSTPGKRNLFSPLDFRTISRRSPLLSKSADSTEDISEPKDNKLNKKTSPFKYTSNKESSDSDISDNHHSLNKPIMKEHNSEKSSMKTPDQMQYRTDSWSAISSKIDQQLQVVIDRLTGNHDVCSGIISGPSSYNRPSRSTLKRKYPSVSSVTDSVGDKSEAENNASGCQDCARKQTFVPRKQFKSEVTPMGPDHNPLITKQTAKIMKELTNTHISNQDLNKKCNIKKRLCNKKIPDEINWKHFQHFKEFDEKFTFASQNRWELTPNVFSPERASSCAKSSEEQHFNVGKELYPFAPLDDSSINSSIIEFNEKKTSKLGNHTIETEPKTDLLDSLRKELIKSTVPQDVEHAVDTGTLDMNETVSEENNSLKEFLIKRKITPLGSEDIEEMVKSSQCITSLWENEQRKRMNAVEKFQSVAQNIFLRINRDLKEAHENELKATLFWTQEMEKIKKYRISMEKELKRLRKAHETLNCELERAQIEGEVSKKYFKTIMKKDIDALQRKLVAKCNEHVLDIMKRCLQMSLLS